jgi:integrase
MPWQDVPAFYRLLGNSVTELALRLLILTGVRSACVRLATPNEFDLAARVWTIPAANLKGRKGATQDFRVPLSDEAVTVVLEALRQGGAVLFSGNQGKAMSELTMRRYMNSRDMTARPHGFRSSFKTWAADTEQPFEVVETSLSHAVGNKVERTYQRSDHLEKRTALMQRWADHLNSKSADNIVSLSGVSL